MATTWHGLRWFGGDPRTRKTPTQPEHPTSAILHLASSSPQPPSHTQPPPTTTTLRRSPMASTTSLLEPRFLLAKFKSQSLKWNPSFPRFPSSARTPNSIRGPVSFSLKLPPFRPRSTAKPITQLPDTSTCAVGDGGLSKGGVLDVIVKALKALRKPVVAALILGILLAFDPYSALAASGGRMGGRSFSAPSRSFSAPSRSYSAPSGSGFSYSVPYYAPSPFGVGGGVYVAPAFGFGIGAGAGSGFFLPMMGFAAMILLSGFLSDRTDDGSVLKATQKTSVLKLQVGLLGMARSFQRDLDRIAETADTSTSEGLSYVLTETTLALLRHPDCCISGYSSVDVKRTIEDGEKCFNQLSIEERGKFDEETLVNVNSIKRQSASSQRYKGFSNEYIVITMLVAAEGVHNLPVINGSMELKEALQKLGAIPASKTLAVEVLWTPQNENDTLTERELLEDYPLLRPL